MTNTTSIDIISKAVEQPLSTNTIAQLDQTNSQVEDKRLSSHLFDAILQQNHLFVNRELLRPSFVPEALPHREQEIHELAQILSPALNHETPSNVIMYGKTGTGKTVVVKYVGQELQTQGKAMGKQIHFLYINAQLVDSLYKILQYIGQHLINNLSDVIPLNGLSIDVLFAKIIQHLDTQKQSIIVALDESDKIKTNDKALYSLTRINEQFRQARLSLICISNDLKFTDSLDARVRSSFGQENMVFAPYDAEQLQDILRERVKVALKSDKIDDEVIPLCSALAAREHGDARKALDLLRVSVEIAERNGEPKVTRKHVRLAQKKIESDCTAEVIKSLPLHSKLVLIAILKTKKNHREAGISEVMTTGEVYDYYKTQCEKAEYDDLTQRRIADFIAELDMLGIITARVISKGRQGRTKEITLATPVIQIMEVLQEDEMLKDLLHYNLKNQRRLL